MPLQLLEYSSPLFFFSNWLTVGSNYRLYTVIHLRMSCMESAATSWCHCGECSYSLMSVESAATPWCHCGECSYSLKSMESSATPWCHCAECSYSMTPLWRVQLLPDVCEACSHSMMSLWRVLLRPDVTVESAAPWCLWRVMSVDSLWMYSSLMSVDSTATLWCHCRECSYFLMSVDSAATPCCLRIVSAVTPWCHCGKYSYYSHQQPGIRRQMEPVLYQCFVPAVLFSILTPLFFPTSSVSLSYFILAVPKRECSGKHSCMSSPFPIAILNGTSFFLSLVQEKLNKPSGPIICFVPEVAVKTI